MLLRVYQCSKTDRGNIRCGGTTLLSRLVPKKYEQTLYDVISYACQQTRKSPKSSFLGYFFKQKLHFLAMMCVKDCLHTFLLNQINKIKHSGSAQKSPKALGPIFTKNGLKGSKKKVKKFQCGKCQPAEI